MAPGFFLRKYWEKGIGFDYRCDALYKKFCLILVILIRMINIVNIIRRIIRIIRKIMMWIKIKNGYNKHKNKININLIIINYISIEPK